MQVFKDSTDIVTPIVLASKLKRNHAPVSACLEQPAHGRRPPSIFPSIHLSPLARLVENQVCEVVSVLAHPGHDGKAGRNAETRGSLLGQDTSSSLPLEGIKASNFVQRLVSTPWHSLYTAHAPNNVPTRERLRTSKGFVLMVYPKIN